ncbi:MAG: hypothetical protein LUE16_03745 [Lachnospiraceae bacterium]|nr:hypothetical protein [Lachnospiraceae bacterium]
MDLNIEGDLNINVILVADGSVVDCDMDPADMIVEMLVPGKGAKVMKFAEADALMPGFMDICVPVDFGNNGLTIYYPENKVIRLGKEVFLFGGAVICSENEDGDLRSLSGEDIYDINQYVEENTVTLCADGRNFQAIRV